MKNDYLGIRSRCYFCAFVLLACASFSQLSAQSGHIQIVLVNQTDRPIDASIGWLGGGNDVFAIMGSFGVVQPGQSSAPFNAQWSVGSEGGTDSIDYRAVIAHQGYSEVGNSYVADGSGTQYVILDSNGLSTSSEPYYGIVNAYPIGPKPTDNKDKTLWLVQDTTLSADLFREGIDKVVAARSTAGSGSASGMTFSEFQSSETEIKALEERSLANERPTPNQIEEFADLARSQAEDAVNASLPDVTPNSTYVPVSSPLTVEFQGQTLDFDPAHHESVAQVCSFLKSLTGWVLIYWFYLWCWRMFNEVLEHASIVPQAKGNPVVGGTGAQATALLAATLITAVMLAVPVSYWAAVTLDFTSLTQSPLTGQTDSIGAAVYLLGQVVPLELCLTLVFEMVVVYKARAVLLFGAAAAVRFFVP